MSKEQVEQTLINLGNPEVPLAQRASQLIDIMAGAQQGEGEYKAIVQEVFRRLANQAAPEAVEEYAAKLRMILRQLGQVPLRPATFVQLTDLGGKGVPHALVIMDNGEPAYVVVHDHSEAKKLKIGDRVLVDGAGKILFCLAANELYYGEEGRLERKVDHRHVEVQTHQDQKIVVMVGKELMDKIDAKQVLAGASIVLGAGQKLGVMALPPPEDKLAFYRFLDKGAIPDVDVDRDIGNPPKVIGRVARHIREEMTRPELRRRFGLRPCITYLLGGVSGTGKSLAVAAIHRKMYEIVAEVTGTPMEKLPPRVFRLRSGQLLSMWFGESDKNIERMFDEVEQVADEPLIVGKRQYRLPVMVVLEEADGLGRARGGDSIYDRIMTVILQRLDPNREGLAKKLVVFLSTTNEPGMVDPAFLRRIGGSVEIFGRLDRSGFAEILRKHTEGLPASDGPRTPAAKAWSSIINSLSVQLFEDPDEQGVIELTYHGQTQTEIKYARDFLTGAMIDRAVQQAATAAWEQAISTDPEAGITASLLGRALDQQVLSVAHQLHPDNVGHYLNIPDGVRVTRIRRLTQQLV